MTLVEWSDGFLTGIEELDGQHKKIVELIKIISKEDNIKDYSEEVNSALKELIEQATINFQKEEELMEQYEYREFQTHRDHHSKIIERIKAIQNMYSKHELRVITNLSSPLKNWFMEDLIEEDKKLSEFLSSKGVT